MLIFSSRMIYVQIPERQREKAIMLIKSGFSVVCLSGNGVNEAHLKVLRRRHIPFQELDANKIRIPEPLLA